MRRLFGLLAAATLVGPPVAGAATREVIISGSTYSPRRAVALTGDTVHWTNRDVAQHTVTSSLFDSGLLSRNEEFAYTFSSAGSVQYRCTVHFGMGGTVAVYDVYLEGPTGAVRFGRPVALRGLAQPGSTVTIERVGDGAAIATVAAGADGRFALAFPAAGPSASYRAVEGMKTSPVVRVLVAPKVVLKARRAGRARILTVSTTPAQPGARVALERGTRAGWRRVSRKTLSARSKATFRVRVARSARFRAKLTRPVGGYAPATSAGVTVRG